MLRRKYWLTEFLSVSSILNKAPARYSRSFQLTQTDDNDLTYFFVYQLGVLHRAINELDAYLARKMAEVKEIKTQIASDEASFNNRQLALLHNAINNPHTSYTIYSHQVSHRVSPETARKDLTELEAEGLLERRRSGKKFMYGPPVDLSERLKARRQCG